MARRFAALHPDQAGDDPATLAAAIEYLRHAQTAALDRLRWGRYAHTVTGRCYGRTDPVAQLVTALYLPVLSEQGRLAEAITVCRTELETLGSGRRRSPTSTATPAAARLT